MGMIKQEEFERVYRHINASIMQTTYEDNYGWF